MFHIYFFETTYAHALIAPLVSVTSSANKLLLQKACMLVWVPSETFRCRHAAGYRSSLFVYFIPVHAGAFNYELHIAIWETDCDAWFGLCQLTWFGLVLTVQLRSPLTAVKKHDADRCRSPWTVPVWHHHYSRSQALGTRSNVVSSARGISF